jgi:hypothetical protein
MSTIAVYLSPMKTPAETVPIFKRKLNVNHHLQVNHDPYTQLNVAKIVNRCLTSVSIQVILILALTLLLHGTLL